MECIIPTNSIEKIVKNIFHAVIFKNTAFQFDNFTWNIILSNHYDVIFHDYKFCNPWDQRERADKKINSWK